MIRPTALRLILLTTFAAFCAAPRTVRASGDFFEEPLTSLPDFLKLDQLPAKRFEQILAETAPPAPEIEPLDLAAEIAQFSKLAGPAALARIDQLLGRARATADFESLKVLNDLRDLYAGPASAAETAGYLAWRTGPEISDVLALEERLKSASPALRPHYLYLRGAVEFLEKKDVESQVWFEKVLREFPKHPRAEIALFMTARAQISRSRSTNYTQGAPDLVPAERPRAKKLLEQYLAKYPKGRWAGDALGWLGAWHFDGGEFSAALRCYLEQLQLPGHPEFAVSATIMCEKTLSHLASEPRANAWEAVAKNPPAAQALVYLLLNTSESNNYNGTFDPADEVRAWRKKLLPQIAAAIAGQESLYKNAVWKPRYLATLALAASGLGQQEQALKLLATADSDAPGDDVLLARGVVLQRAKRSAEAIPIFRRLIENHPESPLLRGARLRLALALADDHQAGRAILELDELIRPVEEEAAAADEEPDNGSYPIYAPIAADQVRQLIDLWLNFSPIEELAAPTLAPDFDPVQRLRFTEAIAQRLLAREEFDEARKYLTPAQFDLVAGPLEKLTKTARAATEPAARAAACLALADAWAEARGRLLTYPLDTDQTRREVYPNEAAVANVRRAEAAAVLGLPGNFRLDLENRDELRHAFNWWLAASDAQPGTPATATALWRALRAMPLIADVSPYTVERARARLWTEVARKLYERLRTECADSVEAQRLAVAWDFPGPRKRKPEEDFRGEWRDAAGARLPLPQIFGVEENDNQSGPEITALAEQARELARETQLGNMEVVKTRLAALRAKADARFVGLADARWQNFFEDLTLFFSEPDPGLEIRERYVRFRLRFLERSAVGSETDYVAGDRADPDAALQKDLRAALADPKNAAIADYLEFLDLAVIANHFTFVKLNQKPQPGDPDILEKGDGDTYRTRDYPLLARQAQVFLAKYPRSKKREAALLLHARAVSRASTDMVLRNYVTWPHGARWEGGYVSTVSSQEPFDAERVRVALQAYEREFPGGRYAGDIRDYRAALALRLRDWKNALALTAEQLADKDRAGLHEAAALRLGELFSLLGDERYRADLLPAIKAQPRARELLKKYLAHESDVHPLRYLGGWLREQLAVR